MQRLSKLSIIIVLVLVAAVALAVHYFGPGNATHDRGDSAGLNALVSAIPADTPFAIVGESTEEGLEEMHYWMQQSVSQKEFSQLLDLLEDNAHPSLPLLVWFIEQYIDDVLEKSPTELRAHYGMAAEGAFAFYMHGLMPVLRVALEDETKFLAILEQGESEAGVSHRVVDLGQGVQARAWPVLTGIPGAPAPRLEVALTVQDKVLTLSLLSEMDEGRQRAERFAVYPLNNNLADDGLLDVWSGRFNRSELMLGFIDIYRLAEAFLLPDENTTGRELKAIFPEYVESLNSKVTPVCRREYVELTRGAPRTLLGMTDYRVSGQEIISGVRAILDIQNESVSKQLQLLPGYVPAYAKTSDDKWLAYALGLDVDALAPVLTELWSQFVGASFECEQLQEFQQGLKQFNPMMVGMGTAMARGVKGLGFALYDLKLDESSPSGLGGSGLVSVSAENPALLASLLTSYAPGMGGLLVPQDGTPVALPALFTPEDVFVAIKGKHLVIYSGEEGQQAAEALASEPLSVNGISGLSVNVGRAVESLFLKPELLAHFSRGRCQLAYFGLLTLGEAPFAMTYSETFNELGWDVQADFAMTMPVDLFKGRVAGNYQVEYLSTDTCEWSVIGAEQLQADGTGNYVGRDEELGCNTYETEYTWSRTGNRLDQEIAAQRERDYCEQGWLEEEPVDFSCSMLRLSTDAFYCVWEDEGDVEVYRYTRQ